LGQDPTSGRSVLRLLFWEALGLAGLIEIHSHPIANHFWDLNFSYNALFFLAAYPILFVYRWKAAGGCLGTLLRPLSFLLSWGLGVSAFIWMTYAFLLTGSPYFYSPIQHPLVLGFLFAFVYFPLVQPLWGISRKYQTLVDLLGVLLLSASCGFLGYEVGWWVGRKFPAVRADGDHWFLMWLGLILLGMAVGALAGQKREKD
jgi:hypothetical protein